MGMFWEQWVGFKRKRALKEKVFLIGRKTVKSFFLNQTGVYLEERVLLPSVDAGRNGRKRKGRGTKKDEVQIRPVFYWLKNYS